MRTELPGAAWEPKPGADGHPGFGVSDRTQTVPAVGDPVIDLAGFGRRAGLRDGLNGTAGGMPHPWSNRAVNPPTPVNPQVTDP